MTLSLRNSFSDIGNFSDALELPSFVLEGSSAVNQESPYALCFQTLDLPKSYCGVRVPILSVLDLSEAG